MPITTAEPYCTAIEDVISVYRMDSFQVVEISCDNEFWAAMDHCSIAIWTTQIPKSMFLMQKETIESPKNEYAHVIIACPMCIFREQWQSTWFLKALRNIIVFLLSMILQSSNDFVSTMFYESKLKHMMSKLIATLMELAH